MCLPEGLPVSLQHLKDPELLKRDLKMVQELVCCSNFVYDNPLDDATRALSEFIITAAM